MSTYAIEPEDDYERPFDPAAPLVASGNLRRRKLVSRFMEGTARSAAFVAVAVLFIVVFAVAKNGASALSIDFLTKDPPVFGGNSGGIAPAIVGTALVVAMATIMAMPIGILIAIYVTEFAPAKVASTVRLALDLINGLPTIVIALFLFELLIVGGHHGNALIASLALAIIMLPLIARGSQEVLLLVPNNLREAADALGVAKRKSVLGVILPAALGGILTSTILAVARAAGETAPVLILAGIFGNTVSTDPLKPVATIPVMIYQLSEQPDPAGISRAWGAGFVLLIFILITSLAGRTALARSRSKLSK